MTSPFTSAPDLIMFNTASKACSVKDRSVACWGAIALNALLLCLFFHDYAAGMPFIYYLHTTDVITPSPIKADICGENALISGKIRKQYDAGRNRPERSVGKRGKCR
ncbi:hypothetical protein [Candidatus Sodalis pierantonius]|uniref:hypothetical protein n=1 Tax=Candidatus Sodalis pierantonii TaxID=1486991 RepID=UPI00138AD9BD|nr:hypothetical protein [Candidatus Sodalis pierantonius]